MSCLYKIGVVKKTKHKITELEKNAIKSS